MKKALSKGPDISKHNGNVNIKKVRDAGYKPIGIRAGYGKNNVDEKYVSNALACFNLAVQVLLYWFSYATPQQWQWQRQSFVSLRLKSTGANALLHLILSTTL